MFSDELQRVPVSYNAVSGSSYGKKASRGKNPLVAMKINLYIDRFLSLTASHIPFSCQRDISEATFNILSFGIRLPKPRKFCMPSIYLAYMIFPENEVSRFRPAMDQQKKLGSL